MPATAPESSSAFLTLPQLAERWQTTRAAIYQARHRGNMPAACRLGQGSNGKLLFRLSDVEAFEQSRLEPSS